VTNVRLVMQLRKTAFLGILVALAVALNILESFFPSPLPWIRLGLANLLTLVAIISCGWREGFLVTVMRVIIASLLFGGFLSPSFLLSLGGGLAGTAVMALMAPGVWRLYSPLGMSVAGAFTHGLAQVIILRFVLVRTWEVLYLLPWVLLPAVLAGTATGLLANLLLVRRRSYFEMLGGKQA
jgi:heptaprenyl diphosphate synthase